MMSREIPNYYVVRRASEEDAIRPGAFSLAGYLEPDPDLPRSPELCGPEMTPSRIYPGPAMTAPLTIPAPELPSTSVLMLGKP